MLLSVEARERRRAQRIGSQAVRLGLPLRGKRRHAYDGSDQLHFDLPDTITNETVIALGKMIKGKQPLLDEFTNNHKAGPDRENISRYVTAGNARRYQPKKRSRPGGPETNPNRIDNPVERIKVLQDMRRQTMHIADLLEREQFNNRNIAILRYEAVKTVQFQLAREQAVDEMAALKTADAIEDFGYALAYNAPITRALHNEDLGYQIAHIGRQAAERPEILAENHTLLRLVRIEEKERVVFWDTRYDATYDYLGDRLAIADREGQATMLVEIDRLQSLRSEQE